MARVTWNDFFGSAPMISVKHLEKMRKNDEELERLEIGAVLTRV